MTPGGHIPGTYTVNNNSGPATGNYTRTGPAMDRHAVLSDCGKYRYSLSRTWDRRLCGVLWVMLNPSTADALNDDPTVRKCIGFSKRWGFGRLDVVNLYAYRAVNPRMLGPVGWPVGPENDVTVVRLARGAGCIILAWGTNAQPTRADLMAHLLTYLRPGRVFTLGTTKGGSPRHPLYVPYDQPLVPWPAKEPTP